MARKPIMAGNWKMNLNHVEATGLVQKLAWTLADKEYDGSSVDCVVIPPFTDLRTVQTLIEGDRFPIQLGAQNVSEHDSGAYTGEVSAGMLSKLGVRYVVVGHSERREYHGETDALINAKALKVLAADMTPIICTHNLVISFCTIFITFFNKNIIITFNIIGNNKLKIFIFSKSTNN